MNRSVRLRRVAALIAVPVVAVLVAASCSTPPGTPAPNYGFKFRASKVTVVNHNDTFFYGTRDEPFVYNLWFRVKVGVPGSAQVGIVGDRAQAFDDLGDGQSHVLVGGERAEVDFPNVQLLDVLDLANPVNGLEIVGTWTWAMEQDDVTVLPVAQAAAGVMENALDATVAAGSVPSDPNALISQLFDDFGQAFTLIAGGLFDSIPGIPDDAIGSRFYVGVAAKGSLAGIINGANVNFPTVDIPVISVPPNIDGGMIFALDGGRNIGGQQFSSSGARHDYDLQVINTATLNKPPVASATASVTSGSAPLAVAFNGAGSSDPDGTVVAYDWNFGDFTTGSGAITSHTFTQPGTYPVTLTVTDNRGDATSTTVTVTVAGAPTVAPTNLQKVGSGCCDTYGDFAWTPVPGADGYEVFMDGVFGQGCFTDHGAVINGQTNHGRVQAVGLCLGSDYEVKIRARANGQWGPWSPIVYVNNL